MIGQRIRQMLPQQRQNIAARRLADSQRYQWFRHLSVLVSRLQSGEQVRLAASKVEQGLQRKISALEQAGYATILLLCTAAAAAEYRCAETGR